MYTNYGFSRRQLLSIGALERGDSRMDGCVRGGDEDVEKLNCQKEINWTRNKSWTL